MKKQELIQLHILLDHVREYADENFYESIDLDPLFSEYENLDIGPLALSSNKSDQKEAVMELADTLASIDLFTDLAEYSGEDLDEIISRDQEEFLEFGGRTLSQNNISRPEAAKMLSRAVEYNPRTVYDRFTDHGISFAFHSEDKRSSAVEELESYASSDIERSEALEIVSEEYGVPEGTLKNWLTDEDITFTESVSALLEPESQRELLETAEHYFDFRSNAEPMEKALGRDRDTLRLYREGEIDTMPVELLERLEALFKSEPRYQLDDPNEYIENQNGRGLVVKDDFQEFLFSHVSTNEFTEMTGKSRTSYNRYTQNKTKYVDEEAFRKVFQAVSYMYGKNPEPEVQAYVDRNSYASTSGSLEDSIVSPEDIDFAAD